MVTRKKKFQSGEGAQYWSRAKAMRKLQLSLKEFRRLCILKGIYPREPRNRSKAQQGAPGIKTLYHKKDIQFLLHEPLIWTLRDMKSHGRKIGRAKGMREFAALKRLIKKRPQLSLNHIVKERYPTFTDALKDLDDCLTLCFLFSTFPSLKNVPRDQSALCRRLTMEFLHAIIHAKALRKVFISIKGFYFQADIQGVDVTWIVPHAFSFEPQSKEEVDFRIMSTFVQFYSTLLGFVNFRLYKNLNLIYPPKFPGHIDREDMDLVDIDSYVSERIAALNADIKFISIPQPEEEEAQLDNFEMIGDQLTEAQVEAEKIKTLTTLFKGLKFFLGREVPREPLTFMLRCFGGEVSWDKDFFIGATFPETDETITHQIVDRPSLKNQYLSRYYVQPQWVFDSVNARELLPVEKYFIGEVLPPHLSPFVDKSRTQYYIPPEEREFDTESKEPSEENKNPESKEEETEEEEEDQAEESEEEASSEEEKEDDEETEDTMKKALIAKMEVKQGRLKKETPEDRKRAEREEFKLREKMVEKKYKRLYKSMMKGRRERMTDVKLLKYKRIMLDKKKEVVPQEA